jgi:hypothetical protein
LVNMLLMNPQRLPLLCKEAGIDLVNSTPAMLAFSFGLTPS